MTCSPRSREMRDKPVPADELEDAKRAIVAGFALSLESPQRMLGYYTESWTYGLPGGLLGHLPGPHQRGDGG